MRASILVGYLNEEFARLEALVQQSLRRHAQCFNYLVYLIKLVAPIEQRLAGVQLNQNATQRPHINCLVVGNAQQNFERSVEAALYVLIDPMAYLTGGAKVNQLDCTSFRVA